MKPILSTYYDTSDDPAQGEGSVEEEDFGGASGSGKMPRTPNMTSKLKNPKSFFPETNFEPKIGGSINYRPEKAKI